MRSCLVIAALLVGPPVSRSIASPPLDVTVLEHKPSTPEPAKAALAAPLPAPRRLWPGEIEMPWIWRTLRERVYSRMPSYEESHDVKIVLAPVVVTSPSDTVPGIGIAGAF